jgi:hypothetical protein
MIAVIRTRLDRISKVSSWQGYARGEEEDGKK